MKQRVVGVLGGMGPESTAELLARIVRGTPVATEQDHLRVIVDSNPKIPDRTLALLSGDTAPVIRALTETARNLERAGAELIGVPCNTAHAFLAEIRAGVGIPVLDMISETADRARQVFGDASVVGLLATDGTHHAGIYRHALVRHGLVPVAPTTQSVQRAVMAALGEVKLRGVSARSDRAMSVAIEDLTNQGATALIAGCTEVSLVLARHPPALPWLDPLQVLADALVREAGGRP
ncbi:MAG: aspartate/glutamate racemase family protein [Thermoanaerobaculales bacterium]